MNNREFAWAPGIFFRVLAVALSVVLLGWVGAIVIYGELAIRDIVGSLLCVPIFSYMVHLWIVYSRESGAGRR